MTYKPGDKTIMVSDSWMDNMSRYLVGEMFKIITANDAEKGFKFSEKLFGKFMARFIEVMLLKSLSERPKTKGLSREELYEFASSNFKETKSVIQDSVAEGFSKGLSLYSGKEVEYYCRIKTVPPVASEAKH